jgi:hypothetical protein
LLVKLDHLLRVVTQTVVEEELPPPNVEVAEAVEALKAKAIGLILFSFALMHSIDGVDAATPSGDEFFFLKTLRWRLRSHSFVAENPANCVAGEEVILLLLSSLCGPFDPLIHGGDA